FLNWLRLPRLAVHLLAQPRERLGEHALGELLAVDLPDLPDAGIDLHTQSAATKNDEVVGPLDAYRLGSGACFARRVPEGRHIAQARGLRIPITHDQQAALVTQGIEPSDRPAAILQHALRSREHLSRHRPRLVHLLIPDKPAQPLTLMIVMMLRGQQLPPRLIQLPRRVHIPRGVWPSQQARRCREALRREDQPLDLSARPRMP